MKTISYCTTCKGRLWQLRQTLPVNIRQTSETCDIVLLDYHSEDGLEDYIKSEFDEYLKDGRLKYYKLVTPLQGFDMAYAKHIVHRLANRDVLFNLDADNFIGETLRELQTLPVGRILIPRLVNGTHTARCGRIGFNRSDYLNINGYDIDMLGMTNDDGDIVHRAWLNGLRFIFSADLSEPISQTREDKFKYIRSGTYDLPDVIEVVNHIGTVTVINLRDLDLRLTKGEPYEVPE
jgi:predicted glycosyltransferase involved in capsule biosynthesis